MKKIGFTKKLSKILIKWFKILRPYAGTTLPGAIMLKVHPDYIKNEIENIKKTKIFITGTNGKTSSTGMLASILEQTGEKILDNRQGANMPQGVATAFLKNDGNPVDYAVFEADEGWLYHLNKIIKADYLLVTNIFLDQTDRFGGVYTIADKIKSAIDLNDMKVVLNADDPHLLPLRSENTIYYGVKEIENYTNDENNYPEMCYCGTEYNYNKKFYAHLGHYSCPNCKNKRPMPDYSAKVILKNNGIVLVINDEITINSHLIGLYNAYNILGVVALSMAMGIDAGIIQKGLDNYKNAFGRTDVFEEKNRIFFVQLIKNPVGANQCINLFDNEAYSSLALFLNDNPADGKDISWIYDVNFEHLKNYKKEIIIGGTRAKELALRLKQAGLNEEKMFISESIQHSYAFLMKRTKKYAKLFILGNYSALRELRKIMKR